MISLDDLGSVLVILVIWPLFAWLLRERVPSSWPASVAWLAPVVVLGCAFAVVGGGSGYLLRWLGRDVRVLAAVVAVAVLVVVLVRATGGSWALAAWFAGCVLLIGVTTLPSESGSPSLVPHPAHALRVCVTDPDRWLPPGLNHVASSDVSAEFIPNIALFAPLGAGLAFLGRGARVLKTRRSRIAVVALPFLVSVSIETFQALFTARVCAPADVMANTTGGVLGGLAVAGLLHLLRHRHQVHRPHRA